MSCNVQNLNFKTIENNIDSKGVEISVDGEKITDFTLTTDLTVLENTQDTFYSIKYGKYRFNIRKEYFEPTDKRIIRYDSRFLKNENKMGVPRKGYLFKKKYFIFDSGLDDVYLLPVITNRQNIN